MYPKPFSIAMSCLITLFIAPHNVDAQEKITGPWLWMIAPTEWGKGGADSINIDSLAVASHGAVTEADVARNGANPGDTIGNYAWTFSEISPTGPNNINEVINQIGWSRDPSMGQYSSYALITLESDRAQSGVAMRVGSDDAIKVWLNGEVVHTNAINRGASGYQDEFPVNLSPGENLLMVKVSQGWSDCTMFVGINADFRTSTQQISAVPERTVQLIYFRPSDRPLQQNIDTKLDTMIKEAQRFYAEQMESYEFGRKTFRVETDSNEKAIVHHINGQFTDAYYQEDPWSRAWEEIESQFSSANIYILFLDVSVDTFCGAASYGTVSGRILIPASGFCLNVRTITHELGHTFGLYHDFRDDAYRMSYGSDSYKLAPCAAECLDVHPYFNNDPLSQNIPTTIEMLPVVLSRSEGLQLRFNVADPDGLHQAQLLTLEKPDDPTGGQQLIACKQLEGNSQMIEFVTAPLKVKPNVAVALRVSDAFGNFTLQQFPDYLGALASVNKITGPWLWMIAPTESGRGGADSINIDSLAVASHGAVTEADIASNGANPGDTVGNYAWTLSEISPTGANNINEVINQIGWSSDPNIDHHSSYALITLKSGRAQPGVAMRVGSDDAIKVWLNGEVVHTNAINRGASDFQDIFVVDLKKGDNLFLVKVSDWIVSWSMFVGINADVHNVYKDPGREVARADVNSDGVVNILDLVLVAGNFGERGENAADINGDGTVNIQDLVLVAGEIGTGTAAPFARRHGIDVTPTRDQVVQWLSQAQQLNPTDIRSLRGILFLEQFLTVLTPKETSVLPNYPNPFNPETWIPYELAESADVTLKIYSVDGVLIRTLSLGHQAAGIYQSYSRAVYWDGQNEIGEPVASGIYFYTFTASDFTATRKMLMRK